ncbi:MAG: DNA-binding protein Alba [Candidatus Micrarchaeota archaeon]|nr:DNA-binding protein Alba [Candidatus Micrarchaeota archaeon]
MTNDKPNTENAKQNDSNTIFIGKKATMSYVLAVMTQFNKGSKQVTLKARGKTISKAVDVAQIVINRFINEVKVVDIKIGTEELTAEDGKKSRISAMEIVLGK